MKQKDPEITALIKTVRRKLNTFDSTRFLGHWMALQDMYQLLNEVVEPYGRINLKEKSND
jgi:hypothetical protein